MCKKAPILSSIWLQSPSPNRSAPSAWAQGPVPNCWGLVRKDYKKAPTNDCSRVHQPLCDSEPSDLGDFGPKHICLHPCWTEPVLLPVLLLALPSLLTGVRLTALQGKNKTKQHNTTQNKIKQESEKTIFIHPLWIRAEHTGNGNPGEKSCVMTSEKEQKKTMNASYSVVQTKHFLFKYKKNPRRLPMIKYYFLCL